MQVLCKHDAMSCRSFVSTWGLESVWVLNPDIHGYQWKLRNVSSLSLSDLSLLTPLHCSLHSPALSPLSFSLVLTYALPAQNPPLAAPSEKVCSGICK